MKKIIVTGTEYANDILVLIRKYFPYTKIDEHELARRMASPAFFYHAAHENKTFAGYAEWEAIDANEKIIRLNGIATRTEFQRKGMAHALMQAGEKVARENGMKKMILLVSENNEPAKKLYEKHGWVFSHTHLKKIGGKTAEAWEKKLV